MSALGNSLRRRLALSKDTRFNTFIGGIGNNITTASQLASLLSIPLNTIRNFKIRNNNISCFITNSYALGNAFGNTNFPISFFVDLQGKVTSTGSAFRQDNQSFDRLRFVYLPNAQVGNEAFRNRGFFNRLTIAIQNSVPVGSTTGNDLVFVNNQNSGQGAINFRVFTDVINQTNNNGNPDGDIQLLINQGSEVVYVPSVKINPPTPTNIQTTQVGGTFAELDFTLPTHVNDYLGLLVFEDGFFLGFFENSLIVALIPETSYNFKVRLVDEFFNVSEPTRFSVLTPALPSLFQDIKAFYPLQETSGGLIELINGIGGTVNGNPTRTGDGYIFSDTSSPVDRIEIQDPNGDLSPIDNSPFSVYFEINPTKTGNSLIMGKRDEVSNLGNYEWAFNDTTRVVVAFNDNVNGATLVIEALGYNFPANQLSKVLLTWEGEANLSGAKLYVNEIEIPVTVTVPATFEKVRLSNSKFTIGNQPYTTAQNRRVNGLIRRPVITKRYIQPSEVSDFFDEVENYYKKVINVVIEAGQSNSEGRLQINHSLTPSYLQNGIVNGVKSFNGSLIEDYDLTNKGQNGNGMEWVQGTSLIRWGAFHVALKEIADNVSNIVSVRVSNGGAILAPFERDSLAQNGSFSADYANIPSSQAKLLEALENRFYQLVQYCQDNNIVLNVKALIWHQGEADGADASSTTAEDDYENNLLDFIDKVRDFTNKPNLPIITGTIPSTSSKFSQKVKDAQLNVASNDSNFYCRINDDLTFFDGLHFDANSCITFGQWIKNTFINDIN